MIYAKKAQKSHTDIIPTLLKALIFIELWNNCNSFHGSRISGQRGCGRGGTPPYSPTPRAHTIKGG